MVASDQREPFEPVPIGELSRPPRNRGGVLVDGLDPRGAPPAIGGPSDAKPGPGGVYGARGHLSAAPAALSILKPNLGVRRQPRRLLSPHRRQALLKGTRIVLVGGEPNAPASEKLAEAFGLTDVEWVSLTEHGSGVPMRAPIESPQTSLVAVIRRTLRT